MPPLATDAHCHVFGPATTFPYAAGRSYTPADAPKQRLTELHAALGIARAVIVQASCHGTDNRAMLDAIATSSGRYRGIAIVDESFTDRDYAALHDGGIRGVRFNFVKHLGGGPDLQTFHRVVQRVHPLGWHLVVHLDATDIQELSGLLGGLPLPFVVDHMGRVPADAGVHQPPFRALLDLMKLDTCWVIVCGAERVS
jgi:2-pyrone-4,6-dicarboxylate lactonase